MHVIAEKGQIAAINCGHRMHIFLAVLNVKKD